jgi:hypothetical protein
MAHAYGQGPSVNIVSLQSGAQPTIYAPSGASYLKRHQSSNPQEKLVGNTVDSFANDGTVDAVRDFSGWQLGTGESASGYFKLVIMTLIASFICTLFTSLLRGSVGGGSVAVIIIGVFVLRSALASLFYAENRAAFDVWGTIAGMIGGSIYWGYGIAMIVAQIGASALVLLCLMGFPGTRNYGGPFINPTANPDLESLTGGQVVLVEALCTGLAIFSYLASYGWKNYMSTLRETGGVRIPPFSKTFMSMDFHNVNTIHAAIVALATGLAYPYTGGALDFFVFLWPSLASGLLADYPLWWAYLVGTVAGLLAAGLLYYASNWLLNKRYKSQDSENRTPPNVA